MSCFIEKPNLPQSNVSSVIISQKAKTIYSNLLSMGIKTILADNQDIFLKGEKYHADLQLIHLEYNKLIAINTISDRLLSELNYRGLSVSLTDITPSECYPNNIIINALILDDKIIGKLNCLDNKLIDLISKKDMIKINVNQGYAKCSVAVVDKNAIITADKAIYSAAVKNKIDVLYISEGSIDLDGFPYGFIGGCSGKLSKDILAFSGNIKLHPDYENIKAFCRNYGVNLLSLSATKLVDIGGIIPLTTI